MGTGGIRAAHYRPLTDEQIGQIHEAALHVLEDVGMEVHSQRCLAAYDSAGAHVDGKRVKIPREAVRHAIVGCVSTIADLRTMGYLSGAVEMGILNAGGAQLAQHWELPYYATAGMSDSKVPDAQAGYEKALSALTTALAGANYIHDAAGLLNFTMTASFEQYVIDNEIIGMLERVLRGIQVDPERMAADAIRGVGPGGNYLAHDHTLKYMRGEFFHPLVSERDRLDVWQAGGGIDARGRANVIAREILAKPPESCLPPDVDAEIQKELGSALHSL